MFRICIAKCAKFEKGTYQTKPTKPNLPKQTYQTKPTKPKLLNQTYQTKPTKPNRIWDHLWRKFSTVALRGKGLPSNSAKLF